jgi:uncharacterized cupin superfamily protein
MSERESAAFDNVADLLLQLQIDPDKPERVGGVWKYASLVSGPIESGVWSGTPASWEEDDYPVNEVMVMLSGRLRVTDTDGSLHDLREGDIFYLPKGWSGSWEIVEDMEKIYFIVP